MRRKTKFWVFTLLCTVAVVAGLLLSSQEFGKFVTAKAPVHEVTLQKPTLLVYNDEGKLKYKMHAETFVQPEHQAAIALTEPDLLWLNPPENWHITAKRGKIIPASEKGKFARIDFLNKVSGVLNSGQNPTTLEFRSEAMSYFPAKELISSDEQMTVFHPTYHLEGQKVRVYLSDNTIEFLDNTKSVYDISQTHKIR